LIDKFDNNEFSGGGKMEDEEDSAKNSLTNVTETKRKKSKWWKILLFFMIFVSSGIFFTFSYLQKSEYIRKMIAENVESLLLGVANADFTIGEIEFISLNEIEIKNALIYLRGDTLAYSEIIRVKYDIWEISGGNIEVEKLFLEKPLFKLIKDRNDSLWNVDVAFSSSENIEDIQDSSKANLRINVGKLIISGGRFQLRDSVELARDSQNDYHHMKYHNLEARKINLNMNAVYNLGDSVLAGTINNLTMKEMGSLFDIEIKGGFSFSKNKTIAKNLSVILADGEIIIDGIFGDYNPLYPLYSDYENADVNCNILLNNIDVSNVEKFANNHIPILGKYDIKSKLNGKLNDLRHDTKIKFGKSYLNINGVLGNMFDDLAYKIENMSGYITESDVLKSLKPLDIKNIPHFQNIEILNSRGSGNLSEVDYSIKFESIFGDINSTGKVIFKDSVEINSKLNGNKINLKNIAGLEKFNTSLNIISNIKLNINNKNKINGSVLLKVNNSIINGELIDSLFVNVISDDNEFIIDDLILDSRDIGNVILDGIISTRDDSSFVEISGKMKKVNLDFLNIKNLPRKISTGFEINSDGFDADKSDYKVNLKNISLKYNNKLIRNINLSIKNSASNSVNNKRKFNLNSTVLDLDMSGDFRFDDLSLLSKNLNLLINNKLRENTPFYLEDSLISVKKEETIFPNINLFLKSNIKINNQLNNLLDLSEFKLISEINLNIKSGNDSVEIITDSGSIKSLIFDDNKRSNKIKNNRIIADNITFSNLFEFSALDNSFGNFYCNLSSENIKIRNNIINSLEINSHKNKNNINFSISSTLNNDIENKVEGEVLFGKNIELSISKLKLNNNNNNFDIINQNKIDFLINSDKIISDDLAFIFNDKTKVNSKLSYDYKKTYINHLNLLIQDYSLSNLSNYLTENVSLSGMLKSMKVSLSGDVENPNIDILTRVDSLVVNDVGLGDLNSELEYKSPFVRGDVYIIDNKNNSNLALKIHSLPVEYNDSKIKYLKNKPTILTQYSTNFPLSVFSSFIPSLSKIKGELNTQININNNSGTLDYNGFVNINKSSLLVDKTNLNYLLDGKISIKTDSVLIDKMQIRNMKSDLRGGLLEAEGFVSFKDFKINQINILLNSEKIKVLSEKTKYSMPTLFGNYILQLDSLLISGNLEEPKINGTVRNVRANLKMPNKKSNQLIKSSLVYIFKNEKMIESHYDSTHIEKDKSAKKGFAELLNYDLDLEFPGLFSVDMVINSLTRLVANVGTKRSASGVRYIKDRNEAEAEFIGEIVLKENSYIYSKITGKKLLAKGTISFPTGEISNPLLDLEATYLQRTNDGIPFEVYLFIKGYKSNPEISFSYKYDGDLASGDPSEITQNAFSLMSLGTLMGDEGGSSDIFDESSFVSQMVSQSLSEAFLDYGMQAEVDFDMDNPDQAVVTLKGNLDFFKSIGLDNVQWSYGSNISNMGENEITVEIPLWEIGGLRFSKSNRNTIIYEDQTNLEFKMIFGGEW
jgi:hypothetical protein